MNCGEEKMNMVVDVFLFRVVMNEMIFLLTPAVVPISSKLMAIIDPYSSLPDWNWVNWSAVSARIGWKTRCTPPNSVPSNHILCDLPLPVRSNTAAHSCS